MRMLNSFITQQNHSSNETVLASSEKFHTVLIVLYIINRAGTLCVIMMSQQLFQRRSQSVMTIMIISLLLLHSFMLLSIPFHLSYYILGEWKLGRFACRLASAIIYLHMYITFAFYMAIIVACILHLEFRKCYTTAWVGAVWLPGALVITPVLLSYFAISKTYCSSECFQFHRELQEAHMVTHCLRLPKSTG